VMVSAKNIVAATSFAECYGVLEAFSAAC